MKPQLPREEDQRTIASRAVRQHERERVEERCSGFESESTRPETTVQRIEK
jgi:hypothetical protein